MDNKNELRLREQDILPTNEILEEVLGNSYIAYETLQETITDLEMEQDWKWYTPHKVWCAKGQYFWTTIRGTRKEKVIYWLYVYEGYFNVAVWFKEKNRNKVLNVDVSEEVKQIICDAKTEMGLLTFPVVIKVTTTDNLIDIYKLMEAKKDLESK